MNFKELALFSVAFRVSVGDTIVQSGINIFLDIIWICLFWVMCVWSVWRWPLGFYGTRTRAACLFLSICGLAGVVVMCAVVDPKDQVVPQLVMVLIIYYTEYFTGTRKNMPRGSLLPITTAAGDQTSIAVIATSTAPPLPAALQHTISDAIKAAAGGALVDVKSASPPVTFSGYTSETTVYSFTAALPALHSDHDRNRNRTHSEMPFYRTDIAPTDLEVYF